MKNVRAIGDCNLKTESAPIHKPDIPFTFVSEICNMFRVINRIFRIKKQWRLT